MKGIVNRAKVNRFLITVLGVIFAVCVVLSSMPIGYASEPKAPIKIGAIYPLTGPYAILGKRSLYGLKVALEETNYNVAGRPIELIGEDTKADPSIGLTKVKKLIKYDSVHILCGVVSSAVAYAIRDTVHESEIPLIITLANAGGLTREKRSPFIFRTFHAGGSPSHYMAQFIYNDLKLRKALFSGPDYAYGHENAKMFKEEFERLGGKVLFQNFSPLGALDFGPHCTELAKFAGKADVLHFIYPAAEGIRFVKTANEYGLQKMFTFTDYGAVLDGTVVNQMGPAANGIYHIGYYIYDIKTRANQKFLDLYKKKGEVPDAADIYGYTGAQVILQALKQVQGNVEDKDRFLKALREVEFESVTGPFKFDSRSQNVLMNFPISQVRKVDGEFGEYQNIHIKTLIQVQDPWWIGR